ncbi:MAG: AsmA family protein [Rhizobiales bacterium]|nr:AsmA family protein [Hyphomicrobiales bacterium]
MRETLTALAALLVIALTVALAGPMFVDWTAHRAEIERRLGESLGASVRIGGAIDLRLLPSPRLDLRDLAISGERPGEPSLSAARGQFELGAAPLLRGDLQFVQARLEAPRFEAAVGAGGDVVLPALSRFGDIRARFDALEIVQGEFVLRGPDGEARRRIAGVDFTGSADALLGPYKGQGRIGGDSPVAFRFSTGPVENGRLRLKLIVDESAVSPRAEFEGAIVSTPTPVGALLAYEGAATIGGRLRRSDGAPGESWRISGPLKADAGEIVLDPLEAKIGDERPMSLTGSARLPNQPDAALTLALSAKQIDLDRVMAAEEGGQAAPLAALAAFARLAHEAETGALAETPTPILVDLAPGAVTLGGETVGDARLMLRLERGQPVSGRLETALPGRSRIVLDGRFEAGSAPRFRGQLDFQTRDSRRLRDWMVAGSVGPAPALLQSAPAFASIAARGRAELSAVSASLRDAQLSLDRSSLRGGLSWTEAVGGERARLYVDLLSDALDLDGLPDLSGFAATSGPDLALSLDARAVRVARFGDGMLDAGRIVAQLTRTDGAVEIERISVAGLGGANLVASGRLDRAGGRFDLDLDAARLTELADLLRRIAPGAWSEALALRAARLSPAKLKAHAEAAPDFALKGGRIDADLAGARLTGSLAAAESGGLTAELSAAHADAATLIRQLGAEIRGAPNKGAGRIEARISGASGGPLATRIGATLAGAAIEFEGAVAAAAGAPTFDGRVRVQAGDVVPLLQATGVVSPAAFARGGVDLTAGLTTREDGLALSGLSGAAFGARVAGEGAWRRVTTEGGSPRQRFEGRLDLEALRLSDLTALSLGWQPAGGPPAAGAWPDRAFAPALADAPETDVQIAAASFDLGAGWISKGASLRLRMSPGLVALDRIEAPLAAGALRGGLALRRDGLDAALSGRLSLAGAAFRRGFAAGGLDADLEFAGAGRSVSAIISGLGGTGAARWSGLTLFNASPGAIAPVIVALDDDKVTMEEGSVARALAAALDGDDLAIGSGEAPINLAGGVLRVGPVSVGEARAETAVTAAYDLKSLRLDLRASFALRQAPRLWTGSPPRLDVMWRGPLEAPRRDIDSGALFNGLAARQIARDLERIEAIEADIRERAAFARRGKAIEFMRRREREIVDYEAEQARLAAEAEKRRLEEERRAAAEAERLRIEEERRQAEEARRAAEAEKRRLEEERRAAAEAERLRIESERRKAEEARRNALQPPLDIRPAPP